MNITTDRGPPWTDAGIARLREILLEDAVERVARYRTPPQERTELMEWFGSDRLAPFASASAPPPAAWTTRSCARDCWPCCPDRTARQRRCARPPESRAAPTTNPNPNGAPIPAGGTAAQETTMKTLTDDEQALLEGLIDYWLDHADRLRRQHQPSERPAQEGPRLGQGGTAQEARWPGQDGRRLRRKLPVGQHPGGGGGGRA